MLAELLKKVRVEDESLSKRHNYSHQISLSPKKEYSPRLSSPGTKGGNFSSFINFSNAV
jgi:hypothetical protein